MKKIFVLFMSAFLCAAIITAVYFVSYRRAADQIGGSIERNNKSLSEKIINLSSEEAALTTLQELTDFEWDRVYQFFPYADHEKIVGNLKGVDLGMSLEGSGDNNILFMNNDIPVCYIRRSSDKWGFKINLNDFSDKGNCVMYNYDDIHTLMIDGSSEYYVLLYMPCDKTEVLYSEGFDEEVKSEIIYSKSEWLRG